MSTFFKGPDLPQRSTDIFFSAYPAGKDTFRKGFGMQRPLDLSFPPMYFPYLYSFYSLCMIWV
jgi:hypothetical protein